MSKSFKLHKSQSQWPSLLCVFITVWILVMTSGIMYMFLYIANTNGENFTRQSDIEITVNSMPVLASSDSQIDITPLYLQKSVENLVDLNQNAPPKAQSVTEIPLTKAKQNVPVETDTIKKQAKQSVPHEDKKQKIVNMPKVSHEDKKQKIVNMPKKDGPKRILKTKDIWGMSMAEQREYLQEINAGIIEPSDKAAREFTESAKAAIAKGVAPDDPPIWENPGAGEGKPGDKIKYKIAGKDVTVPYGYPEETIFILTASYRDPEAASTIARAFARAAHPDRIFVGIHAQNEEGDKEPERDPVGGLAYTGLSCPQHPVCSRLDHIRVSRAHYYRSEGPTVARAKAERLYGNETYVLGIDSHCHFLRGWDNVAIDMFKRIGNDLAIISTYPVSYGEELQRGFGGEPYDPDPTPNTQTAICRTRRVNIHTSITFKHDMNNLARPRKGPVRVAFFAAGFSFSRGHRILRVPYDYHTPYVFDGEETSMGVRAWTWGYDLYQPDRNIISHLYIPSGSPLRPVFWDSPHWDIQWPTQFCSLIRVHKQLRIFDTLADQGSLGRKFESKVDLDEFDRYDTGPRRDPQQFWKWAGIDIQNNWGPNCNKEGSESIRGREHCYSQLLCSRYDNGGMPYVPWKAGTEDLFPPMVRTPQYPPK